MKKRLTIIVALLAVVVLLYQYAPTPLPAQWSAEEAQLIESLSLSRLPQLPKDPSNSMADNPIAAELGHRLYFDTRLSSNSAVSCATCHQPELMFTDGLRLAMGKNIGPRHTPSLVGLSHSPWFYWDGRKDSQWSQALAPWEAAVEHDIDRVSIIKMVAEDPIYRQLYEKLFAPLPDLSTVSAASPLGNETAQENWLALTPELQNRLSDIFANLGKSLAAYQRLIQPGEAEFDDYADAVAIAPNTQQQASFSNTEIAGLKLFIGKAQCISCHNGPLFTNHEFHNTGVSPVLGQLPPMGRYDGIRTARLDPFNCIGAYSDAEASECLELRFARDSNDLVGAQKTPTLRNINLTAPYMHGGQIASLHEVIEHYNEAPVSMLSHNEAKPLGLREIEIRQLEEFLSTLTAPLATASSWLSPPQY